MRDVRDPVAQFDREIWLLLGHEGREVSHQTERRSAFLREMVGTVMNVGHDGDTRGCDRARMNEQGVVHLEKTDGPDALFAKRERARVNADRTPSEAQRTEQLRRLDGIAMILAGILCGLYRPEFAHAISPAAHSATSPLLAPARWAPALAPRW